MTKKAAEPVEDAEETPSPVSRYSLPKTNKSYILSEEAAHEQVMELLGYYDIDIARIEDPEQRKMLERSFDHLRDFVREGLVEISRTDKEKVIVTQTCASGQQIIYREVNAAAKLAQDKHPVEAHYARLYALMGSLSGLGATAIQKLTRKDLAVVEVLGPVFRAA